MLSGFAETAAFLNLGMFCIKYNDKVYNGRVIGWAIGLCVVSRPIQVLAFRSPFVRVCLRRPLTGRRPPCAI